MSSLEELVQDDGIVHPRRAKIVATIGPATRSPETIRALIEAGANIFRLNFSHGTYDQHLEVLQHIRAAAREMGVFIAILQDLAGPKIRITKVDASSDDLENNATVHLRRSNGELSSSTTIYVETVDPSSVCKTGHQILLADGSFVLQVTGVTSDEVECRVLRGGMLRSNIGIAFPDSELDLPATTEKDLRDLAWGIEHQVDYAALSFVSCARDIERARDLLRSKKSDVQLIAKIERKSALTNIDEILEVSDGVMVARGDLGLELPLEKLPIIQKLLIERCNYKGLPVIVATQMLQSMVTSMRPTRAEVADVSLAVLNGTDAIMLSEETAIGQYPIEAVRYLHRIAREAERRFEFSEYRWRLRAADSETVPDAVVYAACGAAVKLNASAIIACTETGRSARLTAKYRPQQPLYGASSQTRTLQRMCLYWGVIPIYCSATKTHSDELSTALKEVQLREGLPNGSNAVVTGGASVGTPGATSIMEIRVMSYRE
jgi:pyruvate kinase